MTRGNSNIFGPYFTSKCINEFINFCSIIGLQRSVEKFFIFFLTLALTTTAGAALAFTFSAMVSVFAVANLLVALVFILYMVSMLAYHTSSVCIIVPL